MALVVAAGAEGATGAEMVRRDGCELVAVWAVVVVVVVVVAAVTNGGAATETALLVDGDADT